jgi:hypothetical protein
MNFNVKNIGSSLNISMGTYGSTNIYMDLIPKGNSFILIDNVDLFTSEHIPKNVDKESLFKIYGRLSIDKLERVLEIDDVQKCISQECCGFVQYEERNELMFWLFLESKYYDHIETTIHTSKILSVDFELNTDKDTEDELRNGLNYPDDEGKFWTRKNLKDKRGMLMIRDIRINFDHS